MIAPELETDRLLLRHWKEEDLLSFAAMNADSRVMECFPAPHSKEESDGLADRSEKALQERGYGLWAVEIKETEEFIGFVGLIYQDFPAPFTPCIEIGWRLAFDYWGKGYAFEAAQKVVEYAFQTLELPEIVSMTAKTNIRSRKLMEKLGMHRDEKDDFNHFKVEEGHPLRPHVLYRLSNPA